MPPPEPYLAQSRRPLASLVFVLPMIVLYEAGTWWLHTHEAGGVQTRVLAFQWLREAGSAAGVVPQVTDFLAPVVVVVVLLAIHLFARHPWRVRPSTPVLMACESVAAAVPLGLMVLLVGGLTAWPMLASPGGGTRLLLGNVVLGLGAGVYEEFAFRLVVFAFLHVLCCDVLAISHRRALPLIVTAGALLFAAYHHVGDEAFTAEAFAFRTAAGVWLGFLYVQRGLGVAAGSHAIYDVGIAIWWWRGGLHTSL